MGDESQGFVDHLGYVNQRGPGVFFTMMLSHSLSAVANGICRTSGLLF